MFRCLALLFALAATSASAETVTVAVASNFAGPARAIAERFEADTGHDVRIVTGSTGKLYAQIVAGAPFDVFLSADEEAPRRLLSEELALSAATYALGRLLVVSADPGFEGLDCVHSLGARRETGSTVAIANPRTAPYGVAARNWLEARRLGDDFRIVYAENVAQVMHFVVSGGAHFGLVGSAQYRAVKDDWSGCASYPAQPEAPAIPQAAALLARSEEVAGAQTFFDYLFTADVRRLIADWGYELPAASPGDA